MKEYEIMTITNIDLGEEQATSISNSIKDLIAQYKGKVLDSDFWGKRKFAYPINGQTEGFYEVIKFEMSSLDLPKFKDKINYINGLVRYLITAE